MRACQQQQRQPPQQQHKQRAAGWPSLKLERCWQLQTCVISRTLRSMASPGQTGKPMRASQGVCPVCGVIVSKAIQDCEGVWAGVEACGVCGGGSGCAFACQQRQLQLLLLLQREWPCATGKWSG